MKKMLFAVVITMLVACTANAFAQTGKRVSTEKTSFTKLTKEQQDAFVNGDYRLVNADVKNHDGTDRMKVTASLVAGVSFSEGFVYPAGAVRFEAEYTRILSGLEVGFTQANCFEGATSQESFVSTFAQASVGYKLAVSPRNSGRYFSVHATSGFAYQMDDDESASYSNSSYGYTFGGFARYSHPVTSRFRLVGEMGYKWIPQTDFTGIQQNVGVYFTNVGVSYVF